jgi:hypothetical protein
MNRRALVPLVPLGPLGLALAAVIGAACTAVTTDAGRAVSLEFDTTAFPAIVSGDTLRDSLGVTAPLHPLAYNSVGSVISGARFTFVTFDTGLTITPAGVVTAQGRNGTVRFLATLSGLQSVQRTLEITRRPDTVFATGKKRDTLLYVLPDVPSSNTYTGVGVTLVSGDSSGGVKFPKGWLVSYRVLYHGTALAKGDSSVATLLGDGPLPSVVDTSDASGLTARRLRVRPVGLIGNPDSLIVEATARYKGAQVRGSPVRFVIITRPKS